MTEPQESAWNSSDVFPSDDALILHFVQKYPDVEDLDETIQDDILGEEFESVKEMASKKIEKVAKRLGLSADLLREIIDAKQKMIEKEQEKISGKNKKQGTSGSIFSKNEGTQKNFKFLKDLLKDDYTIQNEFELENFIKRNDPKIRYLILKNF
jgi:hypothetical protein